jgi:hypothetical protein
VSRWRGSRSGDHDGGEGQFCGMCAKTHRTPKGLLTYPGLVPREGPMLTRTSDQHSPDQKEARRLARQSLRIPYASLLIGGFAILSLLSAVSSIFAAGPVNGMP